MSEHPSPEPLPHDPSEEPGPAGTDVEGPGGQPAGTDVEGPGGEPAGADVEGPGGEPSPGSLNEPV